MNKVEQRADFLTRVGVPLRGLREIGEYMNVTGMTILRWHKCFRGSKNPRLCFPLMMVPSGKGWGWHYQSHTALIADWVRRWAGIDAQRRPPTRKRENKPKKLRIGVTAASHGGGESSKLREAETQPVKQRCTCGTTKPCEAAH